MPRLISVTDDFGDTYYVNPEMIVVVRPRGAEKTEVHLTDGTIIIMNSKVRESMNVLLEALAEAQHR